MFLDELLERTIGNSQLPAVLPRRASRFESNLEPIPIDEDVATAHRSPAASPAPVESPEMPAPSWPSKPDESSEISRERSKGGDADPAMAPQPVLRSEPLRGAEPATIRERPVPEPAAPFAMERPIRGGDELPASPDRASVSPAPGLAETTRVVERTHETETRILERRFEKLERETRAVRELVRPEPATMPEGSAQRDPTTAAATEATRTRVPEYPPAPVSVQSRLSLRTAMEQQDTLPAPLAIHVNIGRVEVRAPANGTSATRSNRPNQPRLSLEDYLIRRERG